PDTTPTAIALLMLSGAIGIGLGDTAYFESLNCLGARRGLLLESLAPPIAALIAWMFLDESLSLDAWLGIGLTVLGVAWVVFERTPDTPDFQTRPRPGIIFGLIAAFAQASGAVLSRSALVGSNISPLWSMLIRIIAGVLVLLVLVTVRNQSAAFWTIRRSHRLIGIIALTAFFSTYLAIWLQQTALKFTAAGIAQALGATSPLFVIPIAMAMGDRVSPRAVLGVLVAIAGVWLLFAQG
ncbi:MAG: DMT family transporter, partial [Synechococcales cyanobacterium T60_A2020_003]|nr:DMT family transporter [Synechococcales cyanobacterium T60_A2020_003]